MKILAIDPGNIESGYVVLNDKLKPIYHGKIQNEILINEEIPFLLTLDITDVAIEMVASYGMAVGKTVFDTCVWVGRFWQATEDIKHKRLIYRIEEKTTLCHDSKAKDSNIRQALIDRFAPNTPNGGKGNKKQPGFFYGFAADQWAAMAVGVTYHDLYLGGRNNGKKM